MTTPPTHPKLYHITHIENLPSIVAEGELLTDAEMIARGGPAETIGMSAIKRRRVDRLEVACHPGTKVGDYVPFYFCPRSIMLFVIHRANHPELVYRGGQEPIVHLEADLHAVVRWARAEDRRWAFSLANAGAFYAQFRSRLDELDQLDWPAIAAANFRAAEVKESKQSEFLVHGRFPLSLVERIGVRSAGVQTRATAALEGTRHRPPVKILPEWYF